MATLAAFFGLALLDSVNPSAIAVTLLLLTRPNPTVRGLLYVAGIFATYLAVGVLLMLGLDAFVARFGAALESDVAYGVQLVLGALMLGYSFVAPRRKPGEDPPPGDARASAAGLGAMVLLGVTITAAELPTAFPYFAAIGLLTTADLGVARWLPLLVIYNLVFVAPPLALLALHRIVGRRFEARFARWRERLRHEARETVLWIVGIVGFVLLADALAHFGILNFIDFEFGGGGE